MDKNNPSQQTIAAYNRFSTVYDDEVTEFWLEFPLSTIEAFWLNLPGMRVLDLGSGPGRDAVLLREAGCEVVCVDGSAAMVEITRRLGFSSHLVTFEELHLEPASFDGVWAYTSLLHVPKAEAIEILRKVGEAIRPRGVLMVGMIEREFEGMVERKSMPGVERFFRYYTAEELGEMVGALGFRLVFSDRYRPHNNVYLHHVYCKM